MQNAALWLAAWLLGKESADATVDALAESGAPEPVRVMQHARAVARTGRGAEPLVRLSLSGAGQPPGLPAGSPAALALAEAPDNGAIVIAGDGLYHAVVAWEVHAVAGPLPAAAHLSPGEADLLLADATRRAADRIAAGGQPSSRLPNPRLTVGSLTDFYEVAGLPAGIAPRAAKLLARADRVAAIIEAVVSAGEHAYDPDLLSLCGHVRTARMTAVDYAVRELER